MLVLGRAFHGKACGMRTNLYPQLPHLDWSHFGDGFRAAMIPEDASESQEPSGAERSTEPGDGALREELRATA
jgi:hypothetical protein